MYGINYQDCIHASSVNMFKKIIDKYLAKAGYAQNRDRLHFEQYQ